MAIGVNSVLSMGVGALFASQASIQTTGNNISNVNTVGYSRQAVVLQERYSINYRPGQVGQGVQAQEIIRYFDAFVERNYLSKLSTASRYQTQYSEMRYVDNLFNEANVDGIYNSLSEMFKAWNSLASEAGSVPAREALLGKTSTLAQSLRNADSTLRELEQQVNTMIKQDVDTANQLMQDIALLNREIAANYHEGRNNPNSLMDLRDAKVRELATIIDVDVFDHGPGEYMVAMKNGNTLVQNEVAFSLKYGHPSVENNLTTDSPYKTTGGTAHFTGQDNYEYTLEMVAGATEIGGTPPARFKVSLDGGKSWLTDDNGNLQLFNAQLEEKSVRVGALEISFDAGDIAAGDRFVISPKPDVYWVTPTSGPINVSSQLYADGTNNPSRITGGSLAGLFEFRDYNIGEYRDRLDALSKTIIWEVNRIHSQGAGLESLTSLTGSYAVGKSDVAMGSPEARFTWADRLQSGNMTFAIFDADGKPLQDYPTLDVFDSLGNFDPSKHSLEDVAAAITATGYFNASIAEGKLLVSINQAAYPGHSFAITSDTTGLAAALGLNTFFQGDCAEDIAFNDTVGSNLNLINSGRLDVFGEINVGDNSTAKEIAALASVAVEIGTLWGKATKQTINDYYGSIVTRVGADTQSAKYTAASETAVAQELYDRQEEISGVNLDEEMSNLIKFQASYKAAAKLITTADEMLQTLLSLKQ